MSTPQSKIVVAIETLLRGMPKASRDVARFEKQLRSLANVKVATKPITTAQFDKAQIAAQKLLLQQQKLAVQTQELANRQERARQSAERLARSQDTLAKATQKASDADKKFRDSQKKFDKRVAAESRTRAQAEASLQKQRSAALIKQFRDQERAAERSAKAFENRFGTLGGIFDRMGQGLASFGRTLTAAVSLPLAALAALSTKSALDLDAQVNTLKAFTGSAEAAEDRLAKLIATAQGTPGLTTSLGLMLDSQLRLANVTVETIDKVLPAIGRLNAVQKLQDPGKFSQNLVQLITQNFERTDLKELVGQSPVAGQLIKEIFNVDSPTNAAAIRESAQKLGLTTTDAFFAAFAEAASRNSALANVTESLATRFEKLADRVTIALRPLGLAIIDAITPAINFLVPIIETLGKGFASLPEPVRLVVVALGGLAVAAGPTVFLLGQMISIVGSLIGTYAQLVTLGLTPTIKGFQLLSQVMRGNAALTAGQAATTAAAAGGWIALAGAIGVAIAVIAVVGIAIAGYAKKQKEAVKIGSEQIAATKAQIDSLQSQIKFIDGLKDGVERTANEQKRLLEIYGALNTQAKIRVAGVTDEEKRLAALRAELERILKLRRDEQLQQAANLAASLANTAAQIEANERARENISKEIQINTRLADSIRATGKIQIDQAKALVAQLGPLGQNIGDVETAVRALGLRNEGLIEQQDDLIKAFDKLNATAGEQGAALAALEKGSTGSARQFLALAKQIGIFTGNIDDALASMDRFIARQEQAAKSTDAFTETLRKQNEEMSQVAREADEASKQRNNRIKEAVIVSKEHTNSLKGALAQLRAFIAAQPELRASFEKEAQLAGKSFDEFVQESLGGATKGRSGTSLRNAQEQVAKAIESVAEASAERQRSIERSKNEDLLQENENSFRLQLIAYEQYLRTRELFTRQNLEIEIREQEAIHTRALAEQQRFLERSQRAGIPRAERTRAFADAAEAEQRAIEAETRIKGLRAEQRRVTVDTNQAIAEAAKQQVEDIRKLDIEFAELRGSIEDALNAATVDRFRERLLALGEAQKFIREQLEIAPALGRDEVEKLKLAEQRNQSEIEAIELIVQQERALNKLAEVNEFVRRAKEEQVELERALAFEVEFRGLKEEDAIKKRLEGERRLADSLAFERDLIQAVIDRLEAAKLPVPQSLLDFVRNLNAEIQGLGELPFSEQFRLVEKEFNRINDERIRKIQDVERAVRDRTIAEVEGQIIIRRINNEYTGDLEAQLVLLKQIADASGQDELKRQAADVGETVKDTKDQVTSLSKEIESAGKDALRSGLSQFFIDLSDDAQSAADDLLSLIDSVVNRIKEVIAERLSQDLFESIFGGPDTESIFNRIGRFFGIGGEGAEGGAGGIAAAGITQTADAATAATALTTGATAAATALTTGGATAGATIVSSMTAAAASFAAAVTAAGAAFAASVAAGAGAQAVGGLGGAFTAATGIFPAVPGGRGIIVEGGYPEAVLTTDPKYAARQYQILRAYLKETRGLFGRIPRFAEGGFISPRQTEMHLLDSITRGPDPISVLPHAALANAGSGQSSLKQRFVFVDERSMRDWMNSSEGEDVYIQKLIKNAPLIRRLTGQRRG